MLQVPRLGVAEGPVGAVGDGLTVGVGVDVAVGDAVDEGVPGAFLTTGKKTCAVLGASACPGTSCAARGAGHAASTPNATTTQDTIRP